MRIQKRTSARFTTVVGCLAVLAGSAYAEDATSKLKYVAKVMVARDGGDLVVPIGSSARIEAPTKKGNQYQWTKNSKRIPGETNSFYVIPAVTREDVGFYSALVTSGSKYPEDVISCPVTLYAYKTNAKGGVEATAPIRVPGFYMKSNPGVVTNVSGSLNPTGGSIPGCPGTYAGYVKFKNASGSSWWTRPAGTTTCTITDESSYPTKVQIVESGTLKSWCGTENVTAPTLPLPRKYQFTTYFTAINPPYSGDTITLLINWN